MKRDTILIVDDDPNILYAMRIVFEKEGYGVVEAEGGEKGLQVFNRERPDLVFLDVTMPDMCGLDVLRSIREHSDIPVVVITGYGTMETAIKAVQLGAYEYITKPLDQDKIRLLAKRALETFRLKKEVERLQVQLDRRGHPFVLIGNSPVMQEIYKSIGAITTTPNTTTVLLQGESGTGKELVARAIHENSGNREEPFVVVNCTVLPEDLLESELFGHEKGAFTGAAERKPGKLELAHNGTILFDEISELSPKLQAKLLRLLQQREFERLGGNEVLKVQARFIAASNRNLEELVKQQRIREDLFYRLKVITIHLPPLRERKEDLPLLIHHIVAKCNATLGKSISAVEPDLMTKLRANDFPGNVRELENIIERAMVVNKGNVLRAESLEHTFAADVSPDAQEGIPISSLELHTARRHLLDKFERKFLEKLLAAANGSITEAARLAKIRRQSLHRMLKRHNFRAEDFRED